MWPGNQEKRKSANSASIDTKIFLWENDVFRYGLRKIMVQVSRPSGVNIGVNNPGGIAYVVGNAEQPGSWRHRVVGDHPTSVLGVEHRQTVTEADIALDDAKVTEIQDDLSFTELNIYFSTVASDIRVDQNIPPALSGSMAGRTIRWDGTIWTNFDDEWVPKADFADSLFSHRTAVQRLNIVATDPDDGLQYPPSPVDGITLGSRHTNIEATQDAHVSIATSDFRFGMIPQMVHGSLTVPAVSVDNLTALQADNSLVSIEYGPAHVAKVYTLGERLVESGVPYISKTDGPQIADFSVEELKWEPQDRDLVLAAALITQTGEIIVDETGRIVRGFAQ